MSGRVGEIRKSLVEVVSEEVKRRVATDSFPSLEKSEFIPRPSSEFQVSLEVMNDRVSGTELTAPLLQDGEPGGVSMNGYRNTEAVASPVKQVFSGALGSSEAQTEALPTGTAEWEVVSAVGTQNYTNKASRFINDMPPEISDNIMLKICRPRDLASLCLTSRGLNALAAPVLYKDIRLGITQGTMFNPRLLHCLIIPEQRNLVHCRVIGVYNEFKRGIVEDTGQTSSATEHMYGMCLLLRDVLRKIPRDHLQSFTWYPDASPHSMILEHLRRFQTRIEELVVFMPLFNPDYRILSNIGGCTSLSTLIVGNIRTTSHLIQLNKLLEKCSKIKSLSLRIEPSMSLQDRQKLLIPDNLMRPDTKHKPSVVELRNFSITQIPQTLKSYISLDNLRILMLVSCENDKELLAAIMASGKKAKLVRFDLVTLTPEGIPEFLSSLQSSLKCLHLYFKEMDAGFSNDLIDSIVSHKDSLEILTIDGRFQTTNTAVAPSRDHLLSLKKLYRLREFAFSPEHYSSDREIRALHALLPCSLRSLNCRIKFNSQMDLPHWANGYALYFINACLKSYSRPLNTDEWGASFGISGFDDYPEIHTKGFNPKQLEIFVLGYVSEIGMIYEVQIVKDRHGTERPLVTEITQDEVSYICDQNPQFLNLVY